MGKISKQEDSRHIKALHRRGAEQSFQSYVLMLDGDASLGLYSQLMEYLAVGTVLLTDLLQQRLIALYRFLIYLYFVLLSKVLHLFLTTWVVLISTSLGSKLDKYEYSRVDLDLSATRQQVDLDAIPKATLTWRDGRPVVTPISQVILKKFIQNHLSFILIYDFSASRVGHKYRREENK